MILARRDAGVADDLPQAPFARKPRAFFPRLNGGQAAAQVSRHGFQGEAVVEAPASKHPGKILAEAEHRNRRRNHDRTMRPAGHPRKEFSGLPVGPPAALDLPSAFCLLAFILSFANGNRRV